jgi:transposase InsO family protein
MDHITTTATIEVLYSLFSRYGLCEEIVSDNGTQFTSNDFSDFCARHGIRHLRTSPGHPQSNGQAERYVDTVKSAIKKRISGGGGDVTQVLTKFLFSYRSTPHATTNISPAELFLKRQLRTVLDLIRPTAKDASSAAQERYKQNFDRHTREREFHVGDKVIVRDFRNATNNVKWTPGILINRVGNRLWNIQVEQQQWKRHENQIQLRHWENNDDDDLFEIDKIPVSADQQPNQQPQQQRIQQQHQPQQLRRSSRVRKPVKRLITEF